MTTVDLRGHGASGPAAPGTSLGDLADDVLGGRRRRRRRAGAPRRVLARRPRRRAPRRSPPGPGRDALPGEQRRASARRRSARRSGCAWRPRGPTSTATVDAAVERWFDDAWRQREPDLVADVRRTMLANDPTSYLACYTVFAVGDQEVGPLLGDITAPTLAITGSDDPGSTPDMSHRLAAADPRRPRRGRRRGPAPAAPGAAGRAGCRTDQALREDHAMTLHTDTTPPPPPSRSPCPGAATSSTASGSPLPRVSTSRASAPPPARRSTRPRAAAPPTSTGPSERHRQRSRTRPGATCRRPSADACSAASGT